MSTHDLTVIRYLYTDRRAPQREEMQGVAWGERTRRFTITDARDLGTGYFRTGILHGLAWDIANGYLAGFRARDIAWFLLTRRTPIWHGMWRRKGQPGPCVPFITRHGRSHLPCARCRRDAERILGSDAK